MVETLQRALAEVGTLPEADQERIGRELLAYLEKLRALRADIDEGIRSIEAGEGRELDIDEVIREARRQNGARS